ncbi:MAG TPA: endonuclease NucS domain-containing protein [Methylibium sp.]|uniref:endonuclease NucS domain-containing protein n=1 Tax=Methylibium sp. TaxID=2067992 RepID=UPI002DBBB192|nr:endonuclease NucS domain-containing protein [Methylibium sp.]HEU4459744.1 endonuclease NucS domain-containing protein [Methylibium sp.]
MPALNDKPVRLLMHDMAAAFGLQPGEDFSRERAIQWFQQHYPNVKEGTVTAHLIRLSTNVRTRLQYSARDDGSDDLFFKIDSSHFRLYEKGRDPVPISSLTREPDEAELERPTLSEEFAFEHDLRDYLARNLQALEPGLRPYTDEGITGVEFPVGGRFIDILAVDKAGDYAVVELKVSKGYDRVVGQLLRYVNWIKKHHAEPDRKVRGIIVAKDISDDLKLACSELPDVALYEYKLSVAVQRVAA